MKIYNFYNFVVLLFSLSILFTGCSNNESMNLEEESMSIESSAKNINVRSAGDGLYDLLGYGYDCRYALADNWKGARNKVIDIERFLTGDAIDPVTGNSVKLPKGKVETSLGNGSMTQTTISGTSLEEFDRHINKNISTESDDFVITGSTFSWGKDEFGKEFDTFFITRSLNSFYKTDLKRNVKILKFSAATNRLKHFLTDDFLRNIKKESAKEIVKLYGTHVLTDITVGGKLSVYVTSDINDFQNNTVKIFNEELLNAIKGNFTKKVKLQNNMTQYHISLIQHGGDANQTIDVNIGTDRYVNIKGFNYNTWLESVTSSKSSLIESNLETIIPLWELIADPIKKQQVFEEIKKRLTLDCTPGLVEYRWNDTFVINNNPNNNGGRKFVSYQWYQDNIPLNGAIGKGQYITMADYHLEHYRTYHCVAVTDKGEVVKTCGMVATK